MPWVSSPESLPLWCSVQVPLKDAQSAGGDMCTVMVAPGWWTPVTEVTTAAPSVGIGSGVGVGVGVCVGVGVGVCVEGGGGVVHSAGTPDRMERPPLRDLARTRK